MWTWCGAYKAQTTYCQLRNNSCSESVRRMLPPLQGFCWLSLPLQCCQGMQLCSYIYIYTSISVLIFRLWWQIGAVQVLLNLLSTQEVIEQRACLDALVALLVFSSKNEMVLFLFQYILCYIYCKIKQITYMPVLWFSESSIYIFYLDVLV